jgi:hypothetical protein
MATDPRSFAPCMAAIFGNPALRARFGDARLAAIRRRTEAENDWIVGRELIRRDEPGLGRGRLRRSFRVAPGAKRAALLALAHIAPLLPDAWRGRFRNYPLRD